MTGIYDVQVKSIDGQTVSLDQYRGRVMLVVNVASQCVFTSQYAGLEELHKQYHAKGLSILGFPCNQFAGQEPGSDSQIQNFCSLKYNVAFDIFSKIDVNGPNSAPLYKYLKDQAPGLLGFKGVKWNFTKFLIGRDGKVLSRYSPTTNPAALKNDIEQALQGPGLIEPSLS